MSIYPAAIPNDTNYPDKTDDVDWIYAKLYNDLKEEVLALCKELGISPSGASATLVARLALLALKSNVLEKDNASAFTPDHDYEPATKKYVDEIEKGASKALDDLASVAINESLISDTDNTDDIGSDAKKWKDGYFAGAMKVLGNVYTAAWANYFSSSTVVGWTSYTHSAIYTKKIGKLVFVSFWIEGTSNSTSAHFTVPYTSVNTEAYFGGTLVTAIDNGVEKSIPCRMLLTPNTTRVDCQSDMGTGIWTASGTKRVMGSFWYETA